MIILYLILTGALCAVAGSLVTFLLFRRYVKKKRLVPFNEDTLRKLLKTLGITPKQKVLNRILKALDE